MKYIIITSVAAYLLGSISPSIMISKALHGTDIRKKGSGNAGATNILRTFGKKEAAVVFAADFLKGFVATLAALLFVRYYPIPYECVYFAGFFVQLGHCFPVYHRFRGGKGVATAAGAATCIMPITALILIAVFILMVAVTKIVSLSSIFCACIYPLLAYFLAGTDRRLLFVFSAACSVLILIMHRTNFARLIDGEEKPVSSK